MYSLVLYGCVWAGEIMDDLNCNSLPLPYRYTEGEDEKMEQNLDLNAANSPQDASEVMAVIHSVLVDLAQPKSKAGFRMNKIRTMLTSSGEAERMTVKLYQAKVNELLNQIERLEQRKTLGQRVKEWFRR